MPKSKKTQKSNNKSSSYKPLTWLLAILILVLGGYILINRLSSPLEIYEVSQVNDLTLSYTPNPYILPSADPVSLMLSSSDPMSAADITLVFDPQVLALTEDIVPNPVFGRIEELTPFAEANQTGQIHLKVSLSPEQIDSPQQGSFALAQLYFRPLQPQVTTDLRLDPDKSSILTPSDYILGDSVLTIQTR